MENQGRCYKSIVSWTSSCLKAITAGTSARITRWHWTGIIGVSFRSLGFFGLGKADSGSFSWCVVTHFFLDFLLVPMTTWMRSLLPVIGDIAVDMSQGLMITERVLARNQKQIQVVWFEAVGGEPDETASRQRWKMCWGQPLREKVRCAWSGRASSWYLNKT